MQVLPVLLVAAAVSVVVGLVEQDGWSGYLVGAVLALTLWLMLLFGSYGQGDRSWTVPARQYAACAAVSVALGWVASLVLGTAPAWAVGFILAGVLWPATARARRDRQPG